MYRFPILSVVICLLVVPIKAGADPSLDQERIENARRMMLVTNTDWQEVIDLWTDDVEYRDPAIVVRGKEEMRTFLSNLFDFMQEYELEIHDEVYRGDIYMVY